MLASINAPDGPASPALASLYAPPRTRVAQVIETVPGWRGFGHVQRIAIAANGCLLVLLAGVFLLVCSSYADGPARALWVAIPATAPLLNVLGLWPCRTWRPLRVLLLLANLAWFGTVAWFVTQMLIAVNTRMADPRSMMFLAAVVLIGLLPPATALWAQLSAWRRG